MSISRSSKNKRKPSAPSIVADLADPFEGLQQNWFPSEKIRIPDLSEEEWKALEATFPTSSRSQSSTAGNSAKDRTVRFWLASRYDELMEALYREKKLNGIVDGLYIKTKIWRIL